MTASLSASSSSILSSMAASSNFLSSSISLKLSSSSSFSAVSRMALTVSTYKRACSSESYQKGNEKYYIDTNHFYLPSLHHGLNELDHSLLVSSGQDVLGHLLGTGQPQANISLDKVVPDLLTSMVHELLVDVELGDVHLGHLLNLRFVSSLSPSLLLLRYFGDQISIFRNCTEKEKTISFFAIYSLFLNFTFFHLLSQRVLVSIDICEDWMGLMNLGDRIGVNRSLLLVWGRNLLDVERLQVPHWELGRNVPWLLDNIVTTRSREGSNS